MDEYQDRLFNAFFNFMPNFYRCINPIFNKEDSDAYQFNENQIKVMMSIYVMEKPTPMEICKAVNIQKGSMTAVVKSLISKDMIKKLWHDHDERSYRLSLTDNGDNYLTYKMQKNKEAINELFQGVEPINRLRIIESVELLNQYFDMVGEGDSNASS